MGLGRKQIAGMIGVIKTLSQDTSHNLPVYHQTRNLYHQGMGVGQAHKIFHRLCSFLEGQEIVFASALKGME
jgi:hypothetical protein